MDDASRIHEERCAEDDRRQRRELRAIEQAGLDVMRLHAQGVIDAILCDDRASILACRQEYRRRKQAIIADEDGEID